MSLHHEDLYTKPTSQIASTSVFVANKIYEQMVILSRQQGLRTCQPIPEKALIDFLASQPIYFLDLSKLTPQSSSSGEMRVTDQRKVVGLIQTSRRLLHIAQNAN